MTDDARRDLLAAGEEALGRGAWGQARAAFDGALAVDGGPEAAMRGRRRADGHSGDRRRHRAFRTAAGAYTLENRWRYLLAAA